MPQKKQQTVRSFWIDTMLEICMPVLGALSQRSLKANMPVEHKENVTDRKEYTYLEALGRTLMGMAPWLENDDLSIDEYERSSRKICCETARNAIAAAVDPDSPDYMNFSSGYQPIVDAAFLCQALLRAPNELYKKLDDRTKNNLISALKLTRTRKPGRNNWLLFSAIIEAFLCKAGESDWDPMRIDYALFQHMQWYKGDGIYGDGSEFHFDYYNSFVIQPMLVDILNAVGDKYPDWNNLKTPVLKRFSHFATVLENIISPDGTYPVIGRSSTYRFGAFQVLSQASLLDVLEPGISPAQARSALTSVIKRVMESDRNFDDKGWLKIGVFGSQPSLGEEYISTGSLYLCSAVFLPLGLSPAHPFWKDPDCDWTSKKIWSGQDVKNYHSI